MIDTNLQSILTTKLHKEQHLESIKMTQKLKYLILKLKHLDMLLEYTVKS